MPTGIEEAFAALLAAATAAAAASPFTTPPDPNLAGSATSDSARFGAAQCLPEGSASDAETGFSTDPGAPGAADPATAYAAPADPTARASVIMFDPVMVSANRPAADVPDGETGMTPVNPSEAPPPTPPPPPEEPPPGQPAGPAPLMPPAAINDNQGSGIPVAADIADLWQQWGAQYPVSPGTMLFGSGEAFGAVAKSEIDAQIQDVMDYLGEIDPEQNWTFPGAVGGYLGMGGDIALAVATVAVDPASMVRSILRLGTGSAQGVDEINEGNTLVGGSMIVGELSTAVLIVVSPIKAGPRTGSMTMYGPSSAAESTPHNVIRAQTATRDMATHAVKDAPLPAALDELLTAKIDPVATVIPYKIADLVAKIEKYDAVTRAVTQADAARALKAMDDSLAASYGGMQGGIGPYGAFQHHCSTYAATISTAGGIPILGVFGPKATMLMFKYMPYLANPTLPLIGSGTGTTAATSAGGRSSTSDVAPNVAP